MSSLASRTRPLALRLGLAFLNALAGLGGDFDKLCGAAPGCGNELILGQFLFDTLGICTVFIDLVDRDYDLDTGCLGVVDGLDGLRHDTVVRSDNQDRDIGGIGTAHTHGCECFMSGCIEEGDVSSVDGDHVGADGLCDTAGFLAGHAGAADRIQKGCFTVVDVAHDADDRRTGDHLGLVLFILAQELFDDINFLLFLAEDIVAECDFFRFFVADFAVGSHHLALQEKLLDDLGSLQVHALCKVADGDLLGNGNCLDLLFCRNFFLLLGTDETSCSVLAGLVLVVFVIDLILSGSAVFLLIAFAAALLSASGSSFLAASSAFVAAAGICTAPGCTAASASGVGTLAGSAAAVAVAPAFLACTGSAASASGIRTLTGSSPAVTAVAVAPAFLACAGSAASALVASAAASCACVAALTGSAAVVAASALIIRVRGLVDSLLCFNSISSGSVLTGFVRFSRTGNRGRLCRLLFCCFCLSLCCCPGFCLLRRCFFSLAGCLGCFLSCSFSLCRCCCLGCFPGFCLCLSLPGRIGLAGLLYRLTVIHFHLCLTDGRLDQLMDRSCLALAAPCIGAACVPAAVACSIAVSGPAVGRSLLTAASALCGTAACAAVSSASLAAGAVCAGSALGGISAGIICTGTAGIGTALSALGIGTGHDDDLFLFGRFFGILSGFFAL